MKKLIIFLIVTFAFSQAPPSFKLKDINVEGNQATSENMVLYTAGLQAGQEVLSEDFRRAVKRLWELGVFSNIQIHFDGETPDGILITIEVEESPVLGTVKFQGNKKLKDKKFREELSYQRDMRIKPNFITKSINTMKKMYMEDGYFLATIAAETETVGEGGEQKQNITFRIREGKKVKIKDIVIDGGVPHVTSVTSSVSNGNYITGDVIPIDVVFTENVTVTDTPQIQLSTGGYALDLDGSDDYAFIPNHSSLQFGTGDFTVSVWFKIDAIGATRQIFCKR